MNRCNHITARGSRVHAKGLRSWVIDWDWFEEGACIEASVEVDEQGQSIVWICDCGCGCEGRAELQQEKQE